MNSKDEFHNFKLKAQVRALGGTNKESSGGIKKKKRKVAHSDEKRRQFR